MASTKKAVRRSRTGSQALRCVCARQLLCVHWLSPCAHLTPGSDRLLSIKRPLEIEVPNGAKRKDCPKSRGHPEFVGCKQNTHHDDNSSDDSLQVAKSPCRAWSLAVLLARWNEDTADSPRRAFSIFAVCCREDMCMQVTSTTSRSNYRTDTVWAYRATSLLG